MWNVFIGMCFCWFVIVGIVDFDGDGILEIVYVDCFYLVKILCILNVCVEDGVWLLIEVGVLDGVINYKYCDFNIEGGICICDMFEVILVDVKWDCIVGVMMDNGVFVVWDIVVYCGVDSLICVLVCE